MQRVRAILSKVNVYPHTRPSQCPYCGGGILHKHGKVQKRVKDIYETAVTLIRYRCVDCKRLFAHYPRGVDHNGRSVRLMALMSLVWVLGLAYRSVGCVLTALGSPASRMSGWRAVQEAGRAAARGRSENAAGRTSVMGTDEAIVKVSKGQSQACGVRG